MKDSHSDIKLHNLKWIHLFVYLLFFTSFVLYLLFFYYSWKILTRYPWFTSVVQKGRGQHRHFVRVFSEIADTKLDFSGNREGKEVFYLTTHSTHFIYGYMASLMVKEGNVLFNKELNTLIARGKMRCCHMGYSFRLAALHIPLPLLHQSWYTGWNEIAQWVHHKGSIPWANTLTTELHLAPH